MNYAIIKSGGKQYKVSVGDTIEVDNLSQEGDKVTFNEVLLLVNDNDIKIGNPLVPNVKVLGKLTENKKGDKIRVAKFKSKVRYRRVTGFRSMLSVVKIEKIETSTKPSKSTK